MGLRRLIFQVDSVYIELVKSKCPAFLVMVYFFRLLVSGGFMGGCEVDFFGATLVYQGYCFATSVLNFC